MTAEPNRRYIARSACGDADIAAAQRLRAQVFRPAPAEARDTDPRDTDPRDADPFDAVCTHVLIEDRRAQALVGCFRLLPLSGGAEIGRSYSAQFYDLAPLAGYRGAMAEIGRFCIHPQARDPDILRAAWGALTRHVDATGVEMLFGCSSFRGTDAAAYRECFALLRDRYLAPPRWRPRIKAPGVIRFGPTPQPDTPDPARALRRMPPLLRSYLAMGGRVSDHAVIDRQLDTLHVFTGLEIRAIPAARQRLLRAVAG